jgi:hypothetical protein
VLLDQGLPADAIAALPLALQPPFVDTPRTLIAARADSLAGRWLRRLGLPTFHLAADRCELVPALPALAAPTLAVTAGLERDAAGAVTDVWIETEGRDRGHMAVLFTPCGELLLPVPGGRLHLASAELQLLRAWLAPLPTGLPIQVLVVAPASADAYGAAELQT